MSSVKESLCDFGTHFYHMVDDVVADRFIDNNHQLLSMSNGSVYMYDNKELTIRRLPLDPDNMTEREFKQEYGEALCRIMQSKDVNQHELSIMTGISQASISNYIQGRVCPSFYIVNKIAKALNVPIEEFTYAGF